MDQAMLMNHFRRANLSLFLNSSVVEQYRVGSVAYQIAPRESRFANMAVNIDPELPVSEALIDQVSAHFNEKNMSYTKYVLHMGC